ncbi:NADPH-dependent FMN reductase [Pedobacter yulinensis]|uniref:NADPH-dependent FMN reductase n=1 Tax=Pedobacter yulinensis TaxID=2126353 RepID=A0A2T3HGT0_9SPHI|nr:NAD(P)H-dependent oxidoreductase [Pedobacter yulinensis]PST81654.1 NADPH-dependent FMN reductase [Pedobacter yulinensis]
MITIISGTNRPGSNSLKVAQYYQQQLALSDTETTLLSLESLPADLIAADLYGNRSAAFQPIQDLVSASSKFLFVIPEYNGSFPGVLKTFIDACSFPASFFDKKAALVGLSSGKYGNIRGIEHFAGICSYLHLHTLPLRIHIPYIREEMNEDGAFFKEDTLKFTAQQIARFIVF